MVVSVLLTPTGQPTGVQRNATRPGVVNRKVWGGSRTHGRRTHERLVTLLRTSAQEGAELMGILEDPMLASLPILPGLPDEGGFGR